MKKVIVVTGASSGFGALASRALANAGHAGELARWGVESTIVVPGAFTKGTNHFAHAGSPADKALAAEYDEGPYAGLPDLILKGIASLEPADADVGIVAEAIVKVVETPFGRRPFRVHVDPSQDGCEIVNGVADRVRAELLRNIGLQDLLTPRDLAAESQRAA
jgi:NAD(P)-dependent dehydrogenase (short-subunit alcohol dehydrogenase family)